jgi:cytochrome c oxidase assembly factor CtaG
VAEAAPALGLAALGAVYALGWSRRSSPRPGQLVAFAGAFATLLVALASPLASRADSSLTAHMVQHVLLIGLAPPLLLVARVGAVTSHALPRPKRRALVAATRPLLRLARRSRWATISLAVAAQVMVMTLWHTPALYDAAATNDALHAFEHLTLFGTAFVLWWAVVDGLRARPVAALLAVLAASTACTALGAAMALAGSPWYPHYDVGSRSAALLDQQMAGAVMWGVTNAFGVVAAAAFVWAWLARLDRDSPARSHAESAS